MVARGFQAIQRITVCLERGVSARTLRQECLCGAISRSLSLDAVIHASCSACERLTSACWVDSSGAMRPVGQPLRARRGSVG
ncbi:MAG: hypothetical protein CM15mP103_08080 [Gammaproteobacteria bacterium]|nr:MAG: hypothetical protein CM15mP103_08080 [Gammaproteobacteria bacterium]